MRAQLPCVLSMLSLPASSRIAEREKKEVVVTDKALAELRALDAAVDEAIKQSKKHHEAAEAKRARKAAKRLALRVNPG